MHRDGLVQEPAGAEGTARNLRPRASLFSRIHGVIAMLPSSAAALQSALLGLMVAVLLPLEKLPLESSKSCSLCSCRRTERTTTVCSASSPLLSSPVASPSSSHRLWSPGALARLYATGEGWVRVGRDRHDRGTPCDSRVCAHAPSPAATASVRAASKSRSEASRDLSARSTRGPRFYFHLHGHERKGRNHDGDQRS
jgi:hypothetical protein